MALEQAKIIRKFPTETFEIVFPWSEMNHVMSYVKNENIEVISKEFTEDCNMIIKVPLHKKDELKIYFSSSSVQMNTSTND